MKSYLLPDFLNNFINLFFAILTLHFCVGFSLVGESRGYSTCSVWASHAVTSLQSMGSRAWA